MWVSSELIARTYFIDYGQTISPTNKTMTNGHAAANGVAVTFDPINRQTVSAEIRQRLVEAIRSGQLAPGSPLPAERVLCHEFGVARTSVREAIQGLVIGGYVERRGNRSVVAERLPEVTFDGDDRKTLVTQLFEVRQVIEPAIAELTARRASEEERAEIAAIAERDTRQLAEFRVLDQQFHAAVARACGNPLLNEVHAKALASLFGSGDLASLLYAEVNRGEVADIITSSLSAHRMIADAIVKGHARKAQVAVVAHLDDVERRMVEHLL
jgi:GntR family transcriptional repressor for pyruvate dehydrogenase complex